jgi:hypothetical protein
MMGTTTIVIAMVCVGIAAGTVGCSTVPPKQDAANVNWTRFVDLASHTTIDNYSETANGKEYFAALVTLGLTNQVWMHRPILVATGTRSQVSLEPTPIICEADSQVLLAAGDVTGDTTPEFIFAAGWWGPMAGVLAVYAQDLHKVAQVETGAIWAVAIGRDQLNRPCIMCREDEHPGNGVFNRFRRMYRYVPGVGLVRDRDKMETAKTPVDRIR